MTAAVPIPDSALAREARSQADEPQSLVQRFSRDEPLMMDCGTALAP